MVQHWRPFERDTVGKQLLSAIDSVNANLVEGDGRYTPADVLHFTVIARASAREAGLWLNRAIERGLVDQKGGQECLESITKATKQLNLLINYRRSHQGRIVRETMLEILP